MKTKKRNNVPPPKTEEPNSVMDYVFKWLGITSLFWLLALLLWYGIIAAHFGVWSYADLGHW